MASTRAVWPTRNRVAFVTRTTLSFSLSSRVSFGTTAIGCAPPAARHRAVGRKVSDEFTVPLCRGHHREVHRCGAAGARRFSVRTKQDHAQHIVELAGGRLRERALVQGGRARRFRRHRSGRPWVQTFPEILPLRSMCAFECVQTSQPPGKSGLGLLLFR